MKREVLISEAAGIFHRRGYAHTSLDDIAAHLGITKAALYHYFPGKQQILFECFVLGFDVTDEVFDSAVRDGHTGRERLELHFRRYILAGMSSPKWMLPVRDMKALTEDMRTTLEKRRQARRDRLRSLVTEGIADGSLRPCDPRIVVSTWAGAAAWIIDTYQPDGELSPEDIADQVTTLFFDGLAPHDTAGSRGATATSAGGPASGNGSGGTGAS